MNPWPGQALAEGELGAALLHIERGHLTLARCALTEAVADGVSAGTTACLFYGAPAVEFVLRCAGQSDRRIEGAVDAVVVRRLAAATGRRARGDRPALAEFDLIRGLTGLGAVLLSRGTSTPLLGEVLAYLVELAEPVHIGDVTLPGWWTDTGPGSEELAGGHANNGMAHGAAGVLALLAIAQRHGAEVSGQKKAIGSLTRWLERYGNTYWLTWDQLTGSEPRPVEPARPSWCYGAVGSARARQLAALALGDSDRRQAAENTAHAALTDPRASHLTVDACLCHGWAGLLTTIRAVAADSPDPDRFTGHITALAGRLSAALGSMPKPGFLEGRAGVELALLGTRNTGWTRALLID